MHIYKPREYNNRIKTVTKIFFILLTIVIISVVMVAIEIVGFWLIIISSGIFLLYIIPFSIITIKESNIQLKKDQEYYKQKLKEEQTNPIIVCQTCQKQISVNASSCPHCGEMMATRCPLCKSADIERIKGLTLYDIVANNFYCKACGKQFK